MNKLFSALFALGCSVSMQANACVDQLDANNSCRIRATIPYESGYGAGDIKVYPASGYSRPTYNKTIVLISGYDPQNVFSFEEIYKDSNQFGLLTNLSSRGYDLVIFKPANSNDYIQRNAFATVELLKRLQNSQDVRVVGLSQGGVIAKYALYYMNEHNINHSVNAFVSFDAPHQGAHVPMGLQMIPVFFDDAADAIKRSTSKIGLFGFRMPDLEFVAPLVVDMGTEELNQAQSLASMLSEQYLTTSAARQLLSQHYSQGLYDYYGQAATDAVRALEKDQLSRYGGSAWNRGDSDSEQMVAWSCAEWDRRASGYGDDVPTVPQACSFLKSRRISYGDSYCESLHKAWQLNAFNVYSDAYSDPYGQNECAPSLALFKQRDEAKVEADKTNRLQQNLQRELANMKKGYGDVYAVAITNGNLAGRKLNIVPGQSYLSYTSQTYKDVTFYVNVNAYSPTGTFFYGRARAPQTTNLLSGGRKNVLVTDIKGTQYGEFLDAESGGYMDFPLVFAELYNSAAGATFGNMQMKIPRHSFISMCSALDVPLVGCSFNSAEDAARFSPFDKVYAASTSASTQHLQLTSYLSNGIFEAMTTPVGAFVGTQQQAVLDDTPPEPVAYGAVGGSGGTAFDDTIKRPGFRIASVTVRSGKRVDAIQVTYADPDGRLQPQPQRGGNGGRATTISLSEGEQIVDVSGISSSGRIHRLTIKTSKGRTFTFGRGTSGTSFQFSGNVIGFFGRSGRELDAIGVWVQP